MVADAATQYHGKVNVDLKGNVISSSPGLFEVWEQKYVKPNLT